ETIPDAGTSPAPPRPRIPRPRLLSAPPRPPEGVYIRGLVTLKCRVLAVGRLEDCAVMTSDGRDPDPRLAELFRIWAPTARLEPPTFEGRPVEVPYVFNFNFK